MLQFHLLCVWFFFFSSRNIQVTCSEINKWQIYFHFALHSSRSVQRCGWQNHGSPKDIQVLIPEPENMLPYMAKGTL